MRRIYVLLTVVFIVGAFMIGRWSAVDPGTKELRAIKHREDSLISELAKSHNRERALDEHVVRQEKHEAKLLDHIAGLEDRILKNTQYYDKKIAAVSRYVSDQLDSFLIARYPAPGIEIRDIPVITITTEGHIISRVEEKTDSVLADQLRSFRIGEFLFVGEGAQIQDSGGLKINPHSDVESKAGGTGLARDGVRETDKRWEAVYGNLGDTSEKVPKSKKRNRDRRRGDTGSRNGDNP
jgi:hypothetical protein